MRDEEELIRIALTKLLWEIEASCRNQVNEMLLEPGLLFGSGGLILMYYNLYKVTRDIKYLHSFKTLFERDFQNLNYHDISMGYGGTGLIYILNIAIKDGLFKEHSNLLDSYDKVILNSINKLESDIDPFNGLLGISNYLLQRPSKYSDKALNYIYKQIENTKVKNERGYFWYADSKDKSVNCGYAHGLPVIIYFLTKINKSQPGSVKYSTISLAIKFLLSYANEKNDNFDILPNYLLDELPDYHDRMSFCYGDLGVAVGLTLIAKELNDKRIFNFAKKMALKVANIEHMTQYSSTDIGLCHGASGNALLFLILYSHHRHIELKHAAIFQYQLLLNLRTTGTGIAGLSSIQYDKEKGQYKEGNDFSYLTGVSGVALSLMSYLSNQLFSGNRILNLS